MEFLELRNVGIEIPSAPDKVIIERKREFFRWIDFGNIRFGLLANSDENPIHRIWEKALRFMEIVYPKAISWFHLQKREFVILQGLSQLTQVEEIALEEYGLLPLSFKVKFPAPLIVFKDEPQLLKIIFSPVGKNEFLIKVRYGFENFDSFFGQPTMESLCPFRFCSVKDRKSGITEEVRKKFKEILNGTGDEIRFRQSRIEKLGYYRSVSHARTPFEKLGEKTYGRRNGFPTFAASRIPSDTARIIDRDIYNKNKSVLIGYQELYFDQQNFYRLKEELTMRTQRKRHNLVDEIIANKRGLVALGRSSIVMK
jgi:hypothetical protein